jgi:hypothetical protein
MKGIRHSGRAAVLPFLFLSGLALIQVPVQNQERLAHTGQQIVERVDRTIDRLVSRLKHFRTVGDLENAGRLFDLLFPSEQGVGVDAAAKIADEPISNRLDDTAGNVKEMSPEAGCVLVFSSLEHEKMPSIELLRPGGESPEILIAAEQWSDGWPRHIRVRKSSDDGRTWPDTVVIGDDHAWTKPSLRQISDDAVGITFVKHRDGEDKDVYFARLSNDLASDAEFPVAYGRAQEDNPALASDHLAFSAPYVYVAYAEHEGAFHSIRFRVSRDSGVSWSRPVTIATFSGPAEAVGETSLAYDPDRGALHVAFTCPQGPSTGIAVSSSLSFGARWSASVFVTAPDDLPETHPRIAAADGTVLVAYEHFAGASGRDIGLAYSMNGGRRWTAGGSLLSSVADESAPDLRASTIPGPPRFFVSYVKDGAQVIAVSCEASNPETWSEERVVQDGISVVDGGPVAVLPMPDPQGEVSAAAAWSVPNPDHDVYFGSERLRSAMLDEGAKLDVEPSDGLMSTGSVGGPFSPVSKDYILRNLGEETLAWTAATTQSWTTLSSTSGMLNEGASTTVTVSINAGANVLAAGAYNDTVSFVNTINDKGSTTRPVGLTIDEPPGSLSVTPGDGLISSGPVGGPFSPSSLTYTLQNTGGTAIDWTAATTQAWTTLSSMSGTLEPGATATVTVSINTGANALAAGTYGDTVSFVNTTNGSGSTTRPVGLTINAGPVLSVTPDNRDVGVAAGTTTFEVANSGGGTMDWTAAVVAGGEWLFIQSGASGTDSGTITVGFTANQTALPRQGIVRVAAAGAAGSPKYVTVTQASGSVSLGLSGLRLVERAWLIEREYGRLTVTVVNPGAIVVNRYVIYRNAGGQGYQILQQLEGSSVSGTEWSYDDTFLEPGTSYAYRIVALDALGNFICQSNEIVI